MGKGYAEGPAVEAAEEARERLLEGAQPDAPPKRRAVLGCTTDDPTPKPAAKADAAADDDGADAAAETP